MFHGLYGPIHSAMELLAAGHGCHRANRLHRPHSQPCQGLLSPLYSPVFSDAQTEARRPSYPRAGDLLAAGNGASPPGTLFRPPVPSLSFPSLIGAIRPRSKDLGWPIPFRRGKFVKEPLPFPEIEPAVLSVFPRIRFLVLKA